MTQTQDGLALEAQTWAQKARGLTVTDRASYLDASHLLQSIKGLRHEVARWFGPHLEAAQATKRQAEAARKGLADAQAQMEAPLIEAEWVCKRALLTWDEGQQRARDAEVRRLHLEAQARAVTLTLEAAAALETEGHLVGDPGMQAEAESLLAQPIAAEAVYVPPAVPAVRGLVYRDHWVVEGEVDVVALARAIGAGTVSPTFLLPNLSALHAYARATKGTVSVPGVRIVNARQLAAKA